MTDEQRAQIVKAALEYRFQAMNAETVWRANARKGASDHAVVTVNAARMQAKEAHDRLFTTIDAALDQED